MNQITATTDRPRAMPKKALTAREPQDLMQVLMQTINNPGFDIEKLNQLREMYREEVADQRRIEYDTAMAACQAEIPTIKANKTNDHTNSSYASLDAMMQVIRPIYTAHGFGVSFGMDKPQVEGCYGVTARVGHSGGYSKEFRADIPIDNKGAQGTVNKTGTHAFGSTVSYAQRYLLKMIFNIAIEGEDKDGTKPGAVITAEQVAELRKLLTEKHIPEAEFVALGRLEQLEDLPASKFKAAKGHLMQAKPRASV